MAVVGWWVEDPSLFGDFDATFGVGGTSGIGFDAAAKHERSFGVGVTAGIGMAASERYVQTFGVGVTSGVGFSGAGTDGLILVGVAANDGNTVDLSGIDYEAGDLIVMWAYSVSVAVPVAPASGGTVPVYSQIDPGGGGDGNASKTFQAVAGATTTSGTFTNANSLIAVVLRNAAVGAHAETGGSVGTAPGLGTYTSPSITPTVTNGTAVQLYFYGGENSASWSTAPAGFTHQITTSDVCLNTKNDTTSDGATAQTAPLVTGQGNFRSAVVEVVLA